MPRFKIVVTTKYHTVTYACEAPSRESAEGAASVLARRESVAQNGGSVSAVVRRDYPVILVNESGTVSERTSLFGDSYSYIGEVE